MDRFYDVEVKTRLMEDEEGHKGKVPIYATEGSACADLASPCDVDIQPRSGCVIDLLLQFDIPKGFKLVMYPRSSLLVKKGLFQPVSIIDSDYKDNIHVPLFNPTDRVVSIKEGERLAQISPECVTQCNSWFQNNAVRNGGFGSTGTR